MNCMACPEGKGFRDDQCEAYNSVPYGGIFYEWFAYYDEDNPCTLTCQGRPVQTDVPFGDEQPLVTVRFLDSVEDGTPCREGSLDMCIKGKCQRVGCDLKLGSKKQINDCGTCGDNVQCSGPLYNWSLVSEAPCSATCGGGYNIVRAACKNRISGEEVDEKFCNVSNKPNSSVIECNKHNCPPRWYADEWGPCSADCDGGTRFRRVFCAEEANGTRIRVDQLRCYEKKPHQEEECNQLDCPKWHTTSWSGCSVSCGEGIRVRSVLCKDNNDQDSLLCNPFMKPPLAEPCSTGIRCPILEDISENFGQDPEEELFPYLGQPEKLVSDQIPSEPTFIPDEWGPCSVTCGDGVRKREVHCKIFLEFSRTIAKLPDSKCSGVKPAETDICYRQPCSAERMEQDIKDDPHRPESNIKVGSDSKGTTYSWREQGYTHCSATCLGGVQELIVNCVRDDTQRGVAPFLCPKDQKPEILIRTCNDHPCPPRWNYSEFSPCSQTCGIGIQTRDVTCIHEVTQGSGNAVIVPNNMCPQPPPPDRQYCNVLDCPVRWRVSDWSKCSKVCGSGEKTRKVECKQVMAQNHTVQRPPSMCPSPKPQDKKPCNTKSCVFDSDRPHIDKSNTTFIQHDPKKKKVTVKIGGAATVFEGTVVKIKCPVKRFNRTRIIWQKDHVLLSKSKKYKTSKKGALRIQNLAYRDSGTYTCKAGKSSADIVLSVRPIPGQFINSEEIQRHQYKNVRNDYEVADIHPPRDSLAPIFSNDDHSHEQRPDLSRRKVKEKLFTPTLPSLTLEKSTKKIQPIPTIRTSNKEDRVVASSARPIKVVDTPSSGNRNVPHFQELISNLQKFWPFQIYRSTKGHPTVANEGKTTLDPKDTLRDEAANENVELEWMVSEWSNCTEEHSKTSFKTRTIECVAKLSNATRAVDSTFCEGAGLEAPSTWIKCEAELCQKASFIATGTIPSTETEKTTDLLQQTKQGCYSGICIAKWKTGPWSKCSAACNGSGYRYRVVHCVWQGTKSTTNPASCKLPQPPCLKACKGPPCPVITDYGCKNDSFSYNVKSYICNDFHKQHQICYNCRKE